MAERGEWRGVYTVLLDSPEFQALSPNAQLCFFLLKLTLGPSGIDLVRLLPYQINQVSPGLDLDATHAALAELSEARWVFAERNVWWLRNGLRWDPTLSLANQNHMKGVSTHLASLPRLGIVRGFCDYYEALGAKGLARPEPLPEWDPQCHTLSHPLSHTPSHPPTGFSTDGIPSPMPSPMGSGMPSPMPPPMGSGMPPPIRERDREREKEREKENSKAEDKSSGGSAPRDVEKHGEKTVRFLMARVREHLYGKAGEPPGRRTEAQDADSIRRLLEAGHEPDYLRDAMTGAARLRDAGKLSFADPGEAMSMGVFLARKHARPFLSEAHDAFLRTREGRHA